MALQRESPAEELFDCGDDADEQRAEYASCEETYGKHDVSPNLSFFGLIFSGDRPDLPERYRFG